MRQYYLGFMAVVLLSGLIVPAYSQGTFSLTFEPANEKNSFWGYGECWGGKLDKAPDSLKTPHSILTEKAAYFLPEVNGRQVIVAIEPSPIRYVVDTDGDGDLSDETPIAQPDLSKPENPLPTVKLKAKDAESAPLTVALKCNLSEDGSPTDVFFRAAGVYRGEVHFGLRTLKIIVADTSFNGRLNDMFEPDKPSDTMSIDYDNDGEFDGWWDELRPLPALTNYGKTVYSVSMAADGSSITFTPATSEKMGAVKVTAPGAIMSVVSAPGAYRLALRGDPVPLPVGHYDVNNIQVCMWDTHEWDEQDTRWRMQCIELPEKLRSFDVREGETTVIEIGPPMKAKAVPVRQGDKIVVNVEVWGSYGERYFPYVRTDVGGLEDSPYGHLVTPPGMKIIDEQGKVLDSGGLEYG